MINKIFFGDCRDSLRAMAAAGVKAQTCVTSPPYFGLRSYGGGDAEIGKEETPEEFIAALVEVFRCVRDVLADDGSLWVNIGDTYASAWPSRRRNVVGTGSLENGKRENRPPRMGPGLKEKDLIGIPWMLAFALRADGWYLRQDIIWHKPNPAPEGRGAHDRCTKAHEHIFLLTKQYRYFSDMKAVREPSEDGLGRNRRSVWTVPASNYKGAHFATFPPALVEPCILAGSRRGDIVLDPFMGSGTTAAVAIEHGRSFIGCELNADYEPLQAERIASAHAKVAAPAQIKGFRKAKAKIKGIAQFSLFGEAA